MSRESRKPRPKRPHGKPGDSHSPRDISLAVSTWFKANAREMPWRNPRDGYRALVSELMLQQTQVARVIPAFDAFMKRFPTCRDLAAATEREVLAAWKGLGYYRRARYLHAAAKCIVDDHEGVVPSKVESLLKLPGIGRYTAGSIASIIFNQPTPIVDGNVHRVLSRVYLKRGHAADPIALKWTWSAAQSLVEQADSPGTFNEGLMELGATICTPRSPACDRCPLASFCLARAQGVQESVPAPKPSAIRQTTHHHVVVITRRGRILVEQRPESVLWSNLSQAITIEGPSRLNAAQLSRKLPVVVDRLRFQERFTHTTTHRDVVFHVFTAATRIRRGQWHSLDQLDDLPLSNPQRRIIRKIAQTPETSLTAGVG
jgi:A/G-specific adenine glycosylase